MMAFYIGEIRKLRNEFFEAYRNGEYKKAVFLGKRLLAIYVEHEDCDGMEYAVDMNNLALVFDRMHLYDRAANYYRKAAELKKECSGESLSYGDTLNNLAIVLNQMGEQAEALELHEKVLEIRQIRLGRTHKDTVHSLYHLGHTYALLEDYEKALEQQEKALQAANQCPQFSGLDLADIYSAIGGICEKTGNFRKSMEYYETCLDLMEKERGRESLYFMQHLLLLSDVCEKADLPELAVEYYETALEIKRGLMRENHLDFINGLNYLATLCCKDKQFDKAIALHQEVLELITHLLGQEHVFYADTLHNLSMDYCGKGEYKKALALGKKALARKKQFFGEENPQIAGSLMNLGILYDTGGKPDEGLRHVQRALEICQNHGTEKEVADTLIILARIYEHQGALEGAATAVAEALERLQRCGEEEKTTAVLAWQFLGELRCRQGEYANALWACRKAADMTERHVGRGHPSYATALERLGLIYESAGDLTGAATALEETAKIRREMLDEDNPRYLDALEVLGRIYTKKEEYEKAIRYYQEKNDRNYEETKEEQLAAANNLLAIANCYRLAGNDLKADAYFIEAEGKLKRCTLSPDEIYESRRAAFFAGRTGKKEAVKRAGGPRGRRRIGTLKRLEECFQERIDRFGVADKEAVRLALALGDLLEGIGEQESAEKWFLLAEKHGEESDYVRACERLGRYWLKQGKTPLALRRLMNAKEYLAEYGDSKSAEYCAFLGLLGDAYCQKGAAENAIVQYWTWSRLYKELRLPATDDFEGRMERAARLLEGSKRQQEAVEFYSTLALSVRGREGESKNFARLILKTAALHVALGNGAKAEALLDRVLLLGGGDGTFSAAFGRLCDRVGRLFYGAGCIKKAEEALRQAYQIQACGEKCMTKEGFALLLELLRMGDDRMAYLAVKNGEKLE